MKIPRPLLPVLLCCFAAASSARADFALRDGDTVAFLGDSITAARGYTKIVEHYTLLRFPERKVRFVNAGKGGDTAAGCLERLERDVFSQGATVVTVAFGVNDIGWGMKANDESKQRYLDGLRAIIEQCRAHQVRPIICSAAITAEAPDKAENGYLQKMTDEGLALAKSLGVETVDLQRGMREAQRKIVAANEKEKDEKKQTRMHVADGIHLSDLGHLAMAYALLKGLGAPEDVSSVVIDAGVGAAVEAKGCRVTEIKPAANGIDFTRLDEGLPMTLGAFSAWDFRWVPISDGIDRYLLTIKNLPPGEYQISAEGRLLGKASAEHLARGLNISGMTADAWQPGGPWDAQSIAVKELVDARDKLWNSGQLRRQSLANHPQAAKIQESAVKLDDDLVTLQRTLAKPYPYHFSVHKAEPSLPAPSKN